MMINEKNKFTLLTEILEYNASMFSNFPALTMYMGYRVVSLNYKHTYELACKIATFLRTHGVEKGDRIVIYAPNSPFWVCVFYGAMLNGAVVVPANIQSTDQMVNKIIEHTQAKIIFKSRYFTQKFTSNIQIFDIEFVDCLTKDIDISDFIKTENSENDLIEILYTSGTTGDPKGVMLTHKNICSNVESISHVLTFRFATERLLSVLPLTHILEQTIGLFLAFYYAAHVVYAQSYAVIASLLCEYKITKIVAVPEILKALMDRIKSEAEAIGMGGLFRNMISLSLKLNCRLFSRILFYFIRKKFGGYLDTIASGGAPLDVTLEKEWNALGFNILQGYGLTETAPVVALNTFTKHQLASVGTILEGVHVKLAPDGEILVKGPNVFSGYYNDQAKTKKAFTPCGWFMTGDVGRIGSDGFLYLSGRKKYMILGAGGQNVFPEDIEAELNKCTCVKDSCVLGLDSHGRNTEIHAVLLLKSEEFSEKVIDNVNKNLASYQQINSWSVWRDDDFPRSATRKVKRDEVLRIIQTKWLSTNNLNPNTCTRVTKILSQISGFEASRIHSGTKIIRDLNMDSLMRVEFVMRVEQELGISLDEAVIDANSTVEQIETMVKNGGVIIKKNKIKNWPRCWLANNVRSGGQLILNFLSRAFMRVEVEGFENVQHLFEPCRYKPLLIMPNHISYFDPLVITRAFPFKLRQKLSFAAAQDVLYEQFKWASVFCDLFFNSFSLPRADDSNIRSGLEAMGKMLDRGYSVVVFPEGKISLDGRLQPIKVGAGLMAVEMDTYVIPVKIEGANLIAPYDSFFPRRRVLVRIKFGMPLLFNHTDFYDEAKIRIERNIKNL